MKNLSVQQGKLHLNLAKSRTYKHTNWLVQKIVKDTGLPVEHQLCIKPPLTRETVNSTTILSNISTSGSDHVSLMLKPSGWVTYLSARLRKVFETCKRVFGRWLESISSLCSAAPSFIYQDAYPRSYAEVFETHSQERPFNQPPVLASATQPEEQTKTTPRLVNLTLQVLGPNTMKILEKGPNFGITQKITPKILALVEAGIERTYYAVKWATFFEDRKRTNDTTDRDSRDSSPTPHPDVTQDSESVTVPHPRPTFRDSDVQQPPNVDQSAEKKLEGLKSKILRLYTQHKTLDKPNVTSSERVELEDLKTDDEIVIKQSDKCKSFVLMNKEDYVRKAAEITDSYQKVEKNPTRELEDTTKDLMRTVLTNKIPQDNLKRLLPQHARTADFYGLAKTH